MAKNKWLTKPGRCYKKEPIIYEVKNEFKAPKKLEKEKKIKVLTWSQGEKTTVQYKIINVGTKHTQKH